MKLIWMPLLNTIVPSGDSLYEQDALWVFPGLDGMLRVSQGHNFSPGTQLINALFEKYVVIQWWKDCARFCVRLVVPLGEYL